jgi:lipid-A-disaccharide synthase
MQKEKPLFLIVCGESSGDLLGGGLALEIFQAFPECRIFGVGGRTMHAAGVELLQTIDNLGVTGFTEVVRKLGHILGVRKKIIAFARRNRPLVVILIDYPDFNLRLAPKLKRFDIPVLYYVSPQLWAWRSYRVKTIQKYIDRMMTLFPFEEAWYKNRGVDAVFVGHPVIQRTNRILSRQECRSRHEYNDDFVVAMLPGSRHNEVSRSLPLFLEAAVKLRQSVKNHGCYDKKISFVIPLAETISLDQIPGYECFTKSDVKIIQGDTLSAVKGADFAWVMSGTAVLETALLGTPHVVVYKTSSFSYWLAKKLVRIKYISAASLVIDDAMAPELIQNDFEPDRLVIETEKALFNDEFHAEFNKKHAVLRQSFGDFNASERAADVVVEFVSSRLNSIGVAE